MPKLISNPTECGNVSQSGHIETPKEGLVPMCLHIENLYNACTLKDEFPTNCPLQDGYRAVKSIEELILLVKQELGKINNPYKIGSDISLITNGVYTKSVKPVMEGTRDTNEIYNEELSDGSGLAQLRHDSKLKPKRRNRKDCKFFHSKKLPKGTCGENFMHLGNMPDCQGVNCSCFETNTE